MHLITRNVNTAFKTLVRAFSSGEFGGDFDYRRHGDPFPVVRRMSRNGDVLVVDEPVTVTYTHPRERVLFNPARDANPFFHLYESLWMLAGRNDVAPLSYYAKNMANYSDDGKTLNGAYGYRWRRDWSIDQTTWREEDSRMNQRQEFDQFDILVNHLKANPNSRRAVLQMWNVEDDLLKISPTDTGEIKRSDGGYEKTIRPAFKDVCCNLSVMFSLWTELDMTVASRSEDLIWGLLGADFVDFTVLQEYMAARLGVEVGRYHHVANNLHVYTEGKGTAKWEPEKWLSAHEVMYDEYRAIEDGSRFNLVPLVKDPTVFDKEVEPFVENFSGDTDRSLRFDEPFLETVGKPLLTAFRYYKRGELNAALNFAGQVAADDWRQAAKEWLFKRQKKGVD